MADTKKGSSKKEPGSTSSTGNKTCPQCGGRKVVAWGTSDVRCGLCNGTGEVRE